MAGAASVAGPVQAQFNTVSTVPFRYRVEVVSAGRDNAVTLPGYTLSVQDTLPPSGDAAPALSADTCKHVWIERYLSVSYPLRRMKINSLYGYRKDPFTGKRKFHNGIDLHARGDEVMAMMAGVVVKVGQDKSSGKYVTLRHGNYTVCQSIHVLKDIFYQKQYLYTVHSIHFLRCIGLYGSYFCLSASFQSL